MNYYRNTIYGAVFFSLLVIPTDSSLGARIRIKTQAEINLESFVYRDDSDPSTMDHGTSMSTQFTFKAKRRRWQNRVQLKALATHNNPERNNFMLQDLWLSYKKRKWHFKGGYQTESWSHMEAFQPFEVLNSRDYDSSLVLPDKIGELLFKGEYNWLDGSISVFLGPLFEPPKFPGANSRLRFAPIDVATPKWADANGNLSESNSGLQYIVRYQQKLGSTDLELFFLDHQDRKFPLFYLENLTLRPVFLPITEIGLALTGAVGQWLIKLEGGQRKFKNSTLASPAITGVSDQPDHTELALGIEYGFTASSGTGHTIYLEHQRLSLEKSDSFSSMSDQQFTEYGQNISLFQNDLFLGYRLNYNDPKNREYIFALISDLERSSEYNLTITYSQNLKRNWKILGGLNIIDAPQKGSAPIGLENRHNDHQVYIKLTRFL